MTIYTTERSALAEEDKKDIERTADNEVEILVDEKLLSSLKDDECNLVYKDPVIPIRKPIRRKQRCKNTCANLCVLLAVLISATSFGVGALYVYRSYFTQSWYWCQVMIPENFTFYDDYYYDSRDYYDTAYEPVKMNEWIMVDGNIEEMKVHKSGAIVPRANIKHDCDYNQTAIKDDDTNTCYVTESHQYVIQPDTLQSVMDSISLQGPIVPADVVTLNYTITNASKIELSATIQDHCGSTQIFQLIPGYLETGGTIRYVQFTGKLLLRYELFGMTDAMEQPFFEFKKDIPTAAQEPIPQP